MNLSLVFEDALQQPVVYIGFKSVSRLRAFIDGYALAMERTNLPVENFTSSFNEWVAKRFRIQTAHSWASIILFMNMGNEDAAFDMTKELWAQYKTELGGQQ